MPVKAHLPRQHQHYMLYSSKVLGYQLYVRIHLKTGFAIAILRLDTMYLSRPSGGTDALVRAAITSRGLSTLFCASTRTGLRRWLHQAHDITHVSAGITISHPMNIN